jgi:cephalosporin hydroxylase
MGDREESEQVGGGSVLDVGGDPGADASRAASPGIVMRASDDKPTPADQAVIDEFQDVWRKCGRLWRATYFGTPILKNPVDLLAYQQIVYDTMPDVIIETGTHHGGSALYLAHLCELMGKGHVITIDWAQATPLMPQHRRLSYVLGDSTSQMTLDRVAAMVGPLRGLVILDSDHAFLHVLREMRLYGQFVATGAYLIVEDTNVNGHPIYKDYGPGPWEAVEVFLEDEPSVWSIDGDREYLGTYNPRGYLKRA